MSSSPIVPFTSGKIVSSLSSSFSNPSSEMSAAALRNLGVAPDHPIASRVANFVTTGVVPVGTFLATGLPIGTGVTNAYGAAANGLGAVSNGIRTVTELHRGNREEAMLHAAQATSQAYNAILNGLVLGAVKAFPPIQLVEAGIFTAFPAQARSAFEIVSQAPDRLISSIFGVKKPNILRLKNQDGSVQEFLITEEQKQKLESGIVTHYSLVPNAEHTGFEIILLSDEEAEAAKKATEDLGRAVTVARKKAVPKRRVPAPARRKTSTTVGASSLRKSAGVAKTRRSTRVKNPSVHYRRIISL